ncbi:MAG TPA: RNA polymerase factor sigma-54, partial [Terriglobales bacterium]|nr:RNA polymerase factor sigma-54 [Terriglobales bacterium]
MVLLQPRLSLKVSQKQILTPGLVQMVSVLALNKLELKDMINAEMVENPVLEELESSVPLLDEVAGREEDREHDPSQVADTPVLEGEKKDPFEEIDFGSFFQEYLDPGYRSPASEIIEKPSFENFLSRPGTLTDHLMWQLGAMSVTPTVREAAELVIGNLNEDGYLIASDEELLGLPVQPADNDDTGETAVAETGALTEPDFLQSPETSTGVGPADEASEIFGAEIESTGVAVEEATAEPVGVGEVAGVASAPEAKVERRVLEFPRPGFTREDLHAAIELVRQMDPVGVAARDLRECLLSQLKYQQQLRKSQGLNGEIKEALEDAIAIVDQHLRPLQNKQYREIGKAIGRPLEAVMAALDYIRTLDPRPGLRYNRTDARLIEPDVAFVKQGDEWVVVMNDDDVPQLRLNPAYRRLLSRDAAEKDVRTYVKERYKSAIQLIKNIEQRKQTIVKVCYAIIGRQRDFLDFGIDRLKPMMIKEVAEEIGVHPSTVSRAVASKYAHTPQGVFELRYFFSESVNGPEGSGTSLLILKRRVKKLIDEEDPARPLTDEQITRILQSQGIQVTRRTVAKYREDMRIPSTHQRRV